MSPGMRRAPARSTTAHAGERQIGDRPLDREDLAAAHEDVVTPALARIVDLGVSQEREARRHCPDLVGFTCEITANWREERRRRAGRARPASPASPFRRSPRTSATRPPPRAPAPPTERNEGDEPAAGAGLGSLGRSRRRRSTTVATTPRSKSSRSSAERELARRRVRRRVEEDDGAEPDRAARGAPGRSPACAPRSRPRRAAPRARSARGDHPGRDGVVGHRVDQDERARPAVVAVRVEEDRRAAADAHAPDVVQRERRRWSRRAERLEVGAAAGPRSRRGRCASCA